MAEPKIWDTPLGASVYYINDRQHHIRGTFAGRESAYVVIETNLGPCRRRRRCHARFVWRDWP